MLFGKSVSAKLLENSESVAAQIINLSPHENRVLVKLSDEQKLVILQVGDEFPNTQYRIETVLENRLGVRHQGSGELVATRANLFPEFYGKF